MSPLYPLYMIPNASLNARFRVPFDHRVHFTRGVLDPANRTLVDALEPTRHGEARVVFMVDSGLVVNDWSVLDRINAYVQTHRTINRVGPKSLIVPGGEKAKNDPSVLDGLLLTIDAAHLCRRSYLVAIGGGAMLDAVGYAAAIAHRGIRLVRLPSTTLAQDDSGVGVKNGINHFGKKNFLGTFAVPHAVINDLDLLTSLEDRDWRSGFSEAVKVAIVKDAAFFDEIEHAAPAIAARDLSAAEPIIRRSAQLHLDHITKGGDPFESTVARPLDFGHWSAHKLEQLSNYTIRHGEAVAIGVALDTLYSSIAGDLPTSDAQRVIAVLKALGFNLDSPLLADPRLVDGLEEFREHLGGQLTISLLNEIGTPYDAHQIDQNILKESIAQLRSLG